MNKSLKNTESDYFSGNVSKRRPFPQYVGYIVIVAISYGMVICSLYAVAAILLVRGVVAESDPLQSF